MVAPAPAMLDGVAALARQISLARPQTAAIMAQQVTRTNWMAALATAVQVGEVPTAARISLAKPLMIAVPMAPPLTQTNSMAALVIAVLVGEDLIVPLMSPARLTKIAAAMAQPTILTAMMMVALVSVNLDGLVTVAKLR